MKIAVIGGGPAGMHAAEIASAGGARVTLYDAKPSVGRKLLVAGKGGLNLTKNEPWERFATRYSGGSLPSGLFTSLIRSFDADALRQWAAGLGIETFAASTGRVYPREMKAAPLLRRWVERLRKQGVEFAMRHRWVGLERTGSAWTLRFDLGDDRNTNRTADAVILALGGASWPQTGSDGQWVRTLHAMGVSVAPLVPANCGWEKAWPEAFLSEAEGQPLKNIALHLGEATARGELLITRYGLEGGALYQLGTALRTGDPSRLLLDLRPDTTAERLKARIGSPPSADRLLDEAIRRWKLSPSAHALLKLRAPFASADALIAAVKAYPLPVLRPRPIDEAISSAGGVTWQSVTPELMLRDYPGVFLAGEMLDWEAPTGGYLIQGCFVTGAHAARSAIAYCR